MGRYKGERHIVLVVGDGDTAFGQLGSGLAECCSASLPPGGMPQLATTFALTGLAFCRVTGRAQSRFLAESGRACGSRLRFPPVSQQSSFDQELSHHPVLVVIREIADEEVPANVERELLLFLSRLELLKATNDFHLRLISPAIDYR